MDKKVIGGYCVCFLLIIIILLLFMISGNSSPYGIKNGDIHLEVQDNGLLKVQEVYTYTIKETVDTIYRTFDRDNGENISNLKVYTSGAYSEFNIEENSNSTKITTYLYKDESKNQKINNKEIKRIGMSQSELYKQEYVNAALSRYKYNSTDDMYAAVGFGAITSSKIISRMLEEYRKEHKDVNIEEKIEELSKTKKINKNVSDSGVIVKGIDNCLVKLSKCCNPVPCDIIICFFSIGWGVSVHRSVCVNVNELLAEEDRIIDVEWYNQKQQTAYTVNIEIYANDRDGLLADVIKELSALKTKIMGVNARANKEKIGIIDLTIEVENIEELNKILKTLRKIDSVYEVKRKK